MDWGHFCFMDIKKLVEKAEERDLSDVAALEDYFESLRLLEKTDDVLAHEKGKNVTKLCSKYAREKLDMRFLDLQERSLLFCAPYDFDSYCRYLEWDREPDKRFYMPRRKQLLPLVNAMQELEDDKLDLLAISLPPGVGKLLADDTPVLTRNGWKTHGELVVGDEVIGLDGEFKKVIAVHPKNVADVLIEFTNGEKIQCHENHEWMIDSGEVFETKAITGMLKDGVRLPNGVCFKSITRVEPKPGNCITVEGGMYLVGQKMVPTHNSTLSLFYLTWLAGRKPQLPILGGSHSNSFLRGAYDECLRIIDPAGEYKWASVFQGLNVINTNAKDLNIDLGQIKKDRKRFPTLEFTSVGSGNAGKVRAGHLLYCDDLCSGIEEALSRDRMDKLWELYATDLRQRKIGNCKELHVATRWSVHDVIGRLEHKFDGNDRARFIKFPALNENDESNFDYKGDVGFSTQFYIDMRDTMDDASWRALYQNEPIEREGQLYSEEELRRYFELPDGQPDAIISVCDTKDKGKDYCVMPICYVYGNDYYIEDIVCDNGKPNIVEERLVQKLLDHNVGMSRFESNSAGGKIAEKVQKEVKEKGGNTRITTKYTTANKETKIVVESGWVKEHCLFKDASVISKDKEYRRAMSFLTGYTMMGKNEHDDVPDAMAMLSQFSQNLAGASTRVIKRPW